MVTFHKTVLEFNSLISQQKFIESLSFYDDGVVVADNLNAPINGKALLQKQIEEFVEGATIEAIEVVSLSSEEDLSFTNWYYSFGHTSLGKFSGHRFSVQRWKNNKIIQEHHFYNE